jgi:hypothetical protein
MVFCSSDGFAVWEDYLFVVCTDTSEMTNKQIINQFCIQENSLKYVDNEDTSSIHLSTEQINELFLISKSIFTNMEDLKMQKKHLKKLYAGVYDGCTVKVILDLYSEGVVLSKEILIPDSDPQYLKLFEYLSKLSKKKVGSTAHYN